MTLTTTISTETLLKRIGAGDETAFREVFRRYKAPFYNAAYKMTRSAVIAEEIVQEVFILLWNKRQQVSAAQKTEAYLLTMLHHSIYAQFRKLARQKALLKKYSEQATDDWEDNVVEDMLQQKENQQLVETAIRKLPEQQQLVYRMAKQEGLSREVIAERLQISPNTVRNHLAAAVRAIRGHFMQDGLPALIWVAIWQSV